MSESTVICFDNSEWMRNGDFKPNRMQQQIDSANVVARAKTMAHPESTVALIAMADRVNVVSTHTNDRDKIITNVLGMKPSGTSKFLTALRVAHLALKHRQNRAAKPRIIIFIGSPMEDVPSEELVKLGRRFKKEKVNVDVVLFGEAETDNADKCQKFIEAANGKEGTASHLVVVPAGSGLNDALSSSPVLRREDGSGPVPGAGGGMDGLDADADPELAMALRVSLEEQRQRQEQQARNVMDATVTEGGGPSGAAAVVAQPGNANPEAMTEEEQLDYALRMSMQADEAAAAAAASGAEPMDVSAKDESTNEIDTDEINPEQLEAMLAGLPGVNPQSATVREAVEEAKKKNKDKKKEEGKKDGEK